MFPVKNIIEKFYKLNLVQMDMPTYGNILSSSEFVWKKYTS